MKWFLIIFALGNDGASVTEVGTWSTEQDCKKAAVIVENNLSRIPKYKYITFAHARTACIQHEINEKAR